MITIDDSRKSVVEVVDDELQAIAAFYGSNHSQALIRATEYVTMKKLTQQERRNRWLRPLICFAIGFAIPQLLMWLSKLGGA